MGDNPGQLPPRPANWDQMTRGAKQSWRQRQKRKAEGARSTEAAALNRPFGGVEQLPPGPIPYKRDEAEGIRGEYREDGDGAASSTAQAVSRWNLAATEGPGGSGTTGNRRGAPASDVNTDAEAFTSAAAAANRGRAAQAQYFETASGRPATGDPSACARRSDGVNAVDRRALQDGAVDRGRDRDSGDVRRVVPARGGEGGAEAHVCDEDTDAATVRKLSKRGPHVPIHVHQGVKARRGTTSEQGGGEGIDTASDHTPSNTRLNMEEAAVGDNHDHVPPRPSNWDHMTRGAK